MRSANWATALLVLGLVLATKTVFAGDLTPPSGPVQPTMKTLDQVEPRRPLGQADVPITITEPGSYVLTETLVPLVNGQTAINIAASDVTLDFRGYGMTTGNLVAFQRGVVVSGVRTNIEIRNGVLRGSLGDGIDTTGADGVRLLDLRISNCGGNAIEAGTRSFVQGVVARNNFGAGVVVGHNSIVRDTVSDDNATGFLIGDGSVVDKCVASNNTGRGFDLGDDVAMSGCSASDNGGIGVVTQENCSLTSVVAVRNLTQAGIFLGAGSTASHCAARDNASVGIDSSASGGVTIVSCSATGNGSSGFSVSNGSTIRDSTSRQNGFAGFSLGSGVTATNCTASFNNDDGFATGTSCTLINCTADNNGQANPRDGFDMGESCTLIGSTASNNSDDGFDLPVGGQARQCTAHSNDGDGFVFGEASVITDNLSSENGGNGFSGSGSYSRIIGNQARSNGGDGFFLPIGADFNLFGRNMNSNDSFNLAPGTSNWVGEITSGVAPSNPMIDDPWANVDG